MGGEQWRWKANTSKPIHAHWIGLLQKALRGKYHTHNYAYEDDASRRYRYQINEPFHPCYPSCQFVVAYQTSRPLQ
jgi:hypothetical protein